MTVGWAVTSIPTVGRAVAESVRMRELTDQEGRKLQRIGRRGSTGSVRYRRAMILPASVGGNRCRRSPNWCEPMRTPSGT
ncbi:hypothetical protein GCM10010358_81130 [Streptomyces minutiscleroticus]|uniref:Transposase n=1 Tax=Streptomyces minutiscleroticus TaxID=68238 RepID=A0A918P3W5_9ACTN|nr:hypothetical protein GCM10010358_81130 [Streptomyces minutiscleroticus]